MSGDAEKYRGRLQKVWKQLNGSPWVEFGVSGEFELPFIGAEYRSGGLMFLHSAPDVSGPGEIITRGKEALERFGRAPLDFLFYAALSGVFLSKYGRDEQLRETARALLASTGGAAHDAAAMIQCLERVSIGRLSQDSPGAAEGDARRRFHERWLETALRAELGALEPFYLVIVGDGKAAWEVTARALEAVAWRRESDLTPIGHVIALRERRLVAEIMYVPKLPENPDELDSVIQDFREFIEGGFLLGSEEFSFVTRS